jgi:enoyl-CoA hydratase/carnithine racemase
VSADPGAVRYERRDTAAVITFDRPGARNALTWPMYEARDDVLDRVASDRHVRVLVLRGAGGHFAAGTDISQFVAFTSAEDGVQYERRLEAILTKLESIPVPTIAAVQGNALGGGLALAAACDVRIATPDARFGVPIARTVGNCLSMANTARLVASLGAARTRTLLLMADFISADEARTLGFVASVIDPEAFETHLDAFCVALSTHAPITLQVTREAIRRIIARLATDGDDLTRRAYGSRDFHEGVRAFVEKRLPHWEGR